MWGIHSSAFFEMNRVSNKMVAFNARPSSISTEFNGSICVSMISFVFSSYIHIRNSIFHRFYHANQSSSFENTQFFSNSLNIFSNISLDSNWEEKKWSSSNHALENSFIVWHNKTHCMEAVHQYQCILKAMTSALVFSLGFFTSHAMWLSIDIRFHPPHARTHRTQRLLHTVQNVRWWTLNTDINVGTAVCQCI